MIPSPLTLSEWEKAIGADASAAGPILQELAARLGAMSAENARLRADLDEWRRGERTAALEARLAELTSQIARLEARLAAPAPTAPQVMLAWTPAGEVLRSDPQTQPTLTGPAWAGEVGLALAAVDEALLALFDSGRVTRWPTAAQAAPLTTEGRERLAALIPLGRLAQAVSVCQVSRLGFVKRTQPDLLSGHIARGYIGAGATLAADRGFHLTILGPGERLALVSRWGAAAAFAPAALPFTVVEALQLPDGDSLAAAFALGEADSLAAITDGGKALVREAAWLETAAAPSRGQALLSPRRREAGARLLGAAAVGPEGGRAVILTEDGVLTTEPLQEIAARGHLGATAVLRAVGF